MNDVPFPPAPSAAPPPPSVRPPARVQKPVWPWFAVPIAFGLGVGLGAFVLAPAPRIEAPVASAAPEPSAAPKPPPKTLHERAAEGEFNAVETLEKKPEAEQTFEDLTSLQRGKQVHKKLAMKGFAKKLAEDPKLATDEDTLKRLREYFQDPVTSAASAELILERLGETGPDLLYEIWTGTAKATEYTEFAQKLLYTKKMRAKASPALAVVLDLRQATECETFKEILPRAVEKGDRRSLRLLAKLIPKRGCGPHKTDDCYACLRPEKGDKDALEVVDAIRAVRSRRGPKIPKL